MPPAGKSAGTLNMISTVWVAGNNPAWGVWTPQMEISEPPYLFTSSGAPEARPSIGALPSVVG